jgi:hypothetical protein
MPSGTKLVYDVFRAVAAGDRFFSSLDVGLDRAGYFDRCHAPGRAGFHLRSDHRVRGRRFVVCDVPTLVAAQGRDTDMFTLRGIGFVSRTDFSCPIH